MIDFLYPILFNTSVLIALTFLHFFWLIGGKTGLKYAFPHNSKHRNKIYRPRTIVLFFTTLILAVMTWFCLALTDSFNKVFDNETIRWGNRISGIIFLARSVGNFRYVGLTKTFKNTEFAQLDTYVYCPLFLIMAICAFISTLHF